MATELRTSMPSSQSTSENRTSGLGQQVSSSLLNLEDVCGIKTPSIICIIQTIKAIQRRMKETDCIDLPYIQVYDKLGQEFIDFQDKHPTIFTKVIRGEDLGLIAAILVYRDKVERGLMTEDQLSEMLVKKYVSPKLQAQIIAEQQKGAVSTDA
ncbi:Hypothetical protein MVR_LOCUS30 [uncultured virus]|nr:Hypothetical protein MVR_LOCUS30 [uncultured virus]